MVEIRKKSNGKKVLVRERAPKKSSAEYEYTPRDRYSRADSRDRRHKEEYRDYYDDHRDHRERQDYYPRFPPQPASTPQFPPPQPVPTFVATKPQLEYKSQVTYGDRPARHGEEVQMSTIMRVTNMHVLHGGMDLDLGLGLDLYIGKKSEVANHIAPKKAAVIAGEINIKHILPLHPRKMSIVGNL
ncbi:hypothetical protein ACMFMG_006722 [Clarireedia jacksonii]